jgi:chromosome segregation ATPase
MRLRNDSEMYRCEHESLMLKYENEIKLRTESEVRFLDKQRSCEALQNELNDRCEEIHDLKVKLKDELNANANTKQELESLASKNKVLESQIQLLRQSVQESSIYKQRMESQVGLMKQQMDRLDGKSSELQAMLDLEQETNKRLTEQIASQQRELRKMEREYEDEVHLRKEYQNERDLLRDKVSRMDAEIMQLVEERRVVQKDASDAALEHRTTQIELNRKVEQLARTESQLEKLQAAHKILQDAQRTLSAESENMRADLSHLEAQVTKESDLRKTLQSESKQLASQKQSLEAQLETSKLNVVSCQRELQEVTEAKVKLESILRDTKSAMQKVSLEQQVELKSHTQKVAMLEKVIADERSERRRLVTETQEVGTKRDDALEQVRVIRLEVRELKRQRLEKEEEVDRLKVLLRAQEQRNTEQLVTLDKYHATVASHDAESRQLQVLLECERQETKRQLSQLQQTFEAAKVMLRQTIEQWKLKYEDLLSRQSFIDTTSKIEPLEKEVKELSKKLKNAEELLQAEIAKVEDGNVTIQNQTARIAEFAEKEKAALKQVNVWKEKQQKALKEIERARMAHADTIHFNEKTQSSLEAARHIILQLEAQLAKARQTLQEIRAASGSVTRSYGEASPDSPEDADYIDRIEEMIVYKAPKVDVADASTQVIISVRTSDAQTDLSYQYLESSDHLQQDKWRRDRLDILKKASHFVSDPTERRDFTVQMRTSAIPVAQIGSTSPRTAPRSVMTLLESPDSTKSGPMVSEPWPIRVPGPPSGGKPPTKVHILRPNANQLAAEADPLQISKVKTTSNKSLTAAELQKVQQNMRSGLTPSPWSA